MARHVRCQQFTIDMLAFQEKFLASGVIELSLTEWGTWNVNRSYAELGPIEVGYYQEAAVRRVVLEFEELFEHKLLGVQVVTIPKSYLRIWLTYAIGSSWLRRHPEQDESIELRSDMLIAKRQPVRNLLQAAPVEQGP